MLSTNTYIGEMLRMLEPLRNMEGFAYALRAALNFNIPCEEFSCEINEEETVIKAKNKTANVELVINADHTTNTIRHFVVYGNENKRALR